MYMTTVSSRRLRSASLFISRPTHSSMKVISARYSSLMRSSVGSSTSTSITQL